MTEETAQQQPADTTSQPQANASELQPGQAPADGGAANAADGAQPIEQQQPVVESEEEQAKKRQRFDKRFSDLTQRARNAELEAARLRGENEALRRLGVQPQQQPAPQAPAAPAGQPDPNDKAKYPGGKFDDNYLVDLAMHKFREEQRVAAEQATAREREAAEQAEVQQGRERFEGTLQEAHAKLDGPEGQYFQNAAGVLELAFKPVSQGGLPRHVIDEITDCGENRVYVAELIGRQPEVLAALRTANPREAARRIGALDAQVSAALRARPAPTNGNGAQTKPAPTPSPAPTPTVTNRGGGAPFNPEKATPAEWDARLASVRAQTGRA